MSGRERPLTKFYEGLRARAESATANTGGTGAWEEGSAIAVTDVGLRDPYPYPYPYPYPHPHTR